MADLTPLEHRLLGTLTALDLILAAGGPDMTGRLALLHIRVLQDIRIL